MEVPARSSVIVIVEQQGMDLLTMVEGGRGEAVVQDGPDNRYGSEVMVLENPSASNAVFDVFVAARYHGAPPAYDIESRPARNDLELELARGLSREAQAWYAGESSAEDFDALLASPGPEDLRRHAFLYALQASIATTNWSRVLELLAREAPQAPNDSLFPLYLQWMKAAALWQTRQLDRSLEEFQKLQPFLSSDFRDQWELKIHQEHIRAQFGAVQVLHGLTTGADGEAELGLSMLNTALQEVSPYRDYRLLGEIGNYMQGYYFMSDSRTHPEVLRILELSAHYFQEAGDPESLAGIKNNQANSYLGLGDLSTAQSLYREALALLEDSRNVYTKAFVTGRLAYTYLLTGDYRKAEFFFRDAISSLYAVDLQNLVINEEIDLGITLRLQGRAQEAVALYLGLVERIQAESALEYSLLRLYTELAAALFEQGEVKEAESWLIKAKAQAEGTNPLRLELEVSVLSARLAIHEGRLDKAESELRNALARIGSAFHEPTSQIEILHHLSQLHFLSDRNESAIRYGKQAMELIADVRSEVDLDRQGPAWSAKSSGIQDDFISSLLSLYRNSGRQEHFDLAFSQIQASRSISLRQLRAAQSNQQRARARRIDARNLAGRWEDMVAAQQDLLAASITGMPTKELELRFIQSEEAFRSAEVSPSELALQPLVFDLQEVQARLDPDEVALIYHLNEPVSYRLQVERDDWRVDELPGKSELTALVAGYQSTISGLRGNDVEAGDRISSLLLPGSLRTAGRPRTLLVQAHGILNQLPFAVLPVAQSPGATPLISRHRAVSVHSLSDYLSSSMSELQIPQSARNEDRLGIAVFADPKFSDLLSSANRSGQSLDRAAVSPLARLPYTALEAEQVMDGFATTGALFMKDQATLENLFTEEVRNARIIHLATHGFSSADSPDEVGLALAPGPDAASMGLLTIENIKAYPFTPELLVISGCETGQGPLLGTEGIMSLSRHFLGQGAKAVLATLWPISDRASASFMGHFYKALRETNDPAESLRQAQLALLSDPSYRHPYYWSGFILTVADSSTRPLP